MGVPMFSMSFKAPSEGVNGEYARAGNPDDA